MEEENLKLVEPCESLVGALSEFFADYGDKAREEDGLGRVLGVELGDRVKRLRELAKGIDLPEGFVPFNSYWLVRDGSTILGTLRLRHRLNENLREVGGHIGYSIRPSERGKGYATRMLSMALPKARRLGLSRVLITCDQNNHASARVIEKNGGVLECKKQIDHKGKPQVCRYYWIEM